MNDGASRFTGRIGSRWRRCRQAALLAFLGVVAGAAVPAAAPARDAALPAVRLVSVRSPTAPGSREPNLASGADGRVFMTWMEPRRAGGLALRLAAFDGRSWTAPTTVAQGDSFFANWADVPSVCPLGGDHLAAHWLWKTGAAPYAYEIRVSFSGDGGSTWSPPIVPHRDGTPTEHGFVSLVPAGDGVMAVWLDGRKTAGHEEGAPGPSPDMTLRSALIAPDGSLSDEQEVDARTCDCCPTAVAATDSGALVAYRDRSADEVRDISLARREEDRWSAPYSLHADGWEIVGCPVNGPALAGRGPHVAVAWFTAAADSPCVKVAFSDDSGTSFGPPLRVDDGDPLGRPQLALLGGGSALVTWLEREGTRARVKIRRVGPGGSAGASLTVARVSAARASGIPRIARSGGTLILAWTETGTQPRVRVAGLRAP